jgi:hypothetical protein
VPNGGNTPAWRSVRNQLLQDRTTFETGPCVVKDDLCYSLIECDAQQDTTLAGHQRVPMIAEPRDVGGDRRYCFGLSASSPDHGGKLIDTL